jgi:predicted nucleic acid-binding protein
MNAVDTNVLFYAHDSRDPKKQETAAELIASLTDGTLLWQVACEYLWASRKLEALGYSYSEAVDDIRYLRRGLEHCPSGLGGLGSDRLAARQL